MNKLNLLIGCVSSKDLKVGTLVVSHGFVYLLCYVSSGRYQAINIITGQRWRDSASTVAEALDTMVIDRIMTNATITIE